MKNNIEKKELLKGIIDIHIHTNPDTRLRRFNDIELAQEAASVEAKAIVIKSHLVPTMDRASIAEFVVPKIRVFGGVVLNSYVGGINPAAVDVAIKMGAKIIWLPTSESEHEKKMQGKSGGIACVADNKPIPALSEVLKIIAENDVVLATGHLSPKESLIVVEEAKKLGVKKILINHPEWWSIAMTIDTQKELAQYGVFFERCYATRPPGDKDYTKNFATNLEAINQLGYESTVLATDGGQTENPMWSDEWVEIIEFMINAGISQNNLDKMTKENPAKLLNM